MVICGDFNSLPQDTPYLYLKRGRLDGGTTEPYLPSVCWGSAWLARLLAAGRPLGGAGGLLCIGGWLLLCRPMCGRLAGSLA